MPRTVTIPTRYDGEDLPWVAQQTRLSTDEVATLHRSATYTVLAVGFMPGFAYLDGLPAALRLPRRDVPRSRVAPGSVAIGGPYAGVYPFASPGGWHLIGTTATRLFDPSRGAALRVGDTVRFVPPAIDDT